MRTVQQIADELEGIYRVGTHKEFREELRKWAESIMDEVIENIAPEDKDSEVINELKQQL